MRGNPRDREEMQRELMRLSQEKEMDFSFQKDDMYRRMRRLICFDMDSTLIQAECIDELARRNGVYDEVAAITASAMRGEIDFKESFTRRVALLKGLDASVMAEIVDEMPITEGTDRLMRVLKTYGYKIAILSGGFTYFGEALQRRYGIDYVYANELEVGEDGQVDRSLPWRDRRWQAQGRTLASHRPGGEGQSRPDHCRRRWRQRPADDQRGRTGHSFHAKPRVRPMRRRTSRR